MRKQVNNIFIMAYLEEVDYRELLLSNPEIYTLPELIVQRVVFGSLVCLAEDIINIFN